MGCFSFICKVSGRAALSTSADGSPCYLFLLKDGKVIEEMYGNYDSYGRVFSNEIRTDVQHELRKSFEWQTDWHRVCDLMWTNNPGDGIAVVLAQFYDGTKPTTQSEQDPDQGWGNLEEGEEDLMCNVSSNKFRKVDNPYHKVY